MVQTFVRVAPRGTFSAFSPFVSIDFCCILDTGNFYGEAQGSIFLLFEATHPQAPICSISRSGLPQIADGRNVVVVHLSGGFPGRKSIKVAHLSGGFHEQETTGVNWIRRDR